MSEAVDWLERWTLEEAGGWRGVVTVSRSSIVAHQWEAELTDPSGARVGSASGGTYNGHEAARLRGVEWVIQAIPSASPETNRGRLRL